MIESKTKKNKNKMNKIKRALWSFYLIFIARPLSLKQFRFYCTKIDGMTKEEWEEMEMEIRNDTTLSNFFKLKNKNR